jgi:hypothetical protein
MSLEEARVLFPPEVFKVDHESSNIGTLLDVLFNICIYQQKEINRLKKISHDHEVF